MEVNNQTSDPVEYEQNGSGNPDPEKDQAVNEPCPQKKLLPTKTKDELPYLCQPEPYKLTLKIPATKGVRVEITEIKNSSLVVTLHDL